jgi:nucleoid-associated protein YgaU
MAAIAYPLPRDRSDRRRVLAPEGRLSGRGGSSEPSEPIEPSDPIELVERRRRRPPIPAARRRAVIRRRLTAIALVVGLVVVLRPLLLPGGDPLVVPGRATPAAAGGTRVYVVQPGDTLWSIARQLHPQDDPRPVVDQLASQLHGSSLQVGQRLALP